MKKFTMMLLLIFAFGVTSVMAQGRTISGRVTDSATKLPVIGATIIVQGTQNGGYTMENGEFSISNVEGAVKLEFSMIGYKDAVVAVAAAVTNVNVSLESTSVILEEVVVIAYGVSDKKSLTGSVAVVSAEKIEDRPVTNIVNAIAGATPGVQTTSASGAPGSTPAVRIRGIGSINGSSTPLYVVDGVPFTGDINAISPDDISSMSILKDAASTALYGSKGSNGVIMIQTKTGRKERVTFNVRINEGFMYRALPEYEKLGYKEYYELGWEALRNNGTFSRGMSDADAANFATSNAFGEYGSWYNILKDKNTGKQMLDKDVIKPFNSDDKGSIAFLNPNATIMDGYENDLDWMDQITKIGFRQNYSISASGGTDMTSYYTSVGYTNEDSYFKNTSYERINARTRVDIRPTKWLKVGTNLSISNNISNNPYVSGDYESNPWASIRSLPNIYPVHMHDQRDGSFLLNANGNKIYDNGLEIKDGNTIIKRKRNQLLGRNIIEEGGLNKTTSNNLSLFGQMYGEVDFGGFHSSLQGLKFTVDAAVNRVNSSASVFLNPIIGDQAGAGSLAKDANTHTATTFKQILEWDRKFDRHSVGILLGHESFEDRSSGFSAMMSGAIMPTVTEFANFKNNISINGNSIMVRTEGYFARMNYNFDEKYYFSGSYRRDGSSKFSPANRWGDFWSLGGTWIISGEDFMSSAMWVDFLKLRASYGTNGNDGGSSVSVYNWMSLYSMTDYGGNGALTLRDPGAPDLKWETAGSLDVGFDFRFFNRLNGSITYFEKSSDELIFQTPVPSSNGIRSTLQNVGSMVNRGVELALDVDVVRTNNWLWNVGVNVTWLQNRITKLPGHAEKEGISIGAQKLMVGHSIYDFYLPQFGFIDRETGALYYELDEDLFNYNSNAPYHKEVDGKRYTERYTEAREDFSGDGLSPITGSISSSLTWKNLTLDLLFTYRVGGKAFDTSYQTLMIGTALGSMSADMVNSWRQPGDVTKLPRLEDQNQNLYTSNSGALIDNSFIALQNVTLTYNFPQKIANKLTLKGLSIYATGENLFQKSSLIGYDAMASFNGVVGNNNFGGSATVSFGINISF